MIGIAIAAATLALLTLQMVVPQRAGPLALVTLLEPYLIAGALMALLFGWRRSTGWTAAIGIALLTFTVFRLGPTYVSLPPAEPIGNSISAVAWNVLAGRDDGPRLIDGIAGLEADLIALEELQPEGAQAIEADAALVERFPSRVLNAHATVLGTGLLSRHPIVEQQTWFDPPLIRAVVQPAGQTPIVVFVGHPLPARIDMLAGVPIGIDATARDQKITFIRSQIDVDLRAGRSVIVLGDFNITDHEPGYHVLATDLRDSHLDVGLGPGFTWRPARLAALPMGLLRIDYVLASLDFRFSASSLHCGEERDHCRIGAIMWRTATTPA